LAAWSPFLTLHALLPSAYRSRWLVLDDGPEVTRSPDAPERRGLV
jgi:hypothetical protein